ncbi:DUF4381 domain-containing protein [Haliea sp. E17]|uniref:DUF4381 domain-containing protein n=1 Tax=Haliea sp. E17 TaxID=3401576 RepID=UPI003AAE5BF7
MSDSTSLDRLHDIVAPAAAPWWPPAPGWQILLGVLAALAALALLRGFIRWQGNHYRREALAELAALRKRGERGDDAGEVVAHMSVLLKRVALTAFPRTRVATLSGEAWFAFLDRTGGTRFAAGTGALMEAVNYGIAGNALAAQDLALLESQLRHWIRHHRVLPESAAEPAGRAATRAGDPEPVLEDVA